MTMVLHNSRFPKYRSRRLRGYNYEKPDNYFVTIVTKNRKPIFGQIKAKSMELNEIGLVVRQSWEWLKNQYDYVELDEFIIMPNHLHGIVVMRNDRCVSRNAPASITTKRKSLDRLIGAFKTVLTKQINQINKSPGSKIWQRDFHDQIIRDSEDLDRIRHYIKDNPQAWSANGQ